MGEFYVKSKETNTFRFKTFTDRVNEIDIRQSALYRIGHGNEELDEGEEETVFAQTLRKWSVLNLTREFSDFFKKCQGIVTLPQLLHRKDYVVDILHKSLDSCSPLALDPILEVLVAFAKDIREEFYAHFDEFFKKLIRLLHTQDSDLLESVLRCLAHLFKSLRPFLKRNIAVVLGHVVPLLDEECNPEYVVNFASECFSFVARDVKDYDKFLYLTIKHVAKQNGGLSGCGKLFFELIRGAGGNFHSVAEDFLKSLLNCFLNAKYDQNMIFEIMSSTLNGILEHINVHNFTLFWKLIVDVMMQMVVKQEELPPKSLLFATNLTRQFVEWKKGRAITDVSEVVTLLVKMVEQVGDENVLIELIAISSVILHSDSVKLSQMDASRLICKMLTVGSEAMYERFVWSMGVHPQFEVLVLPNFLNYFENACNAKKLDMLMQIVRKRQSRTVSCVWSKHPIKLKKKETFSWLERNIKGFDITKGSVERLELYILSTMCYPHLVGANEKLVYNLLKENISKMKLHGDGTPDMLTAALVSIEALLSLNQNVDESFLNGLIDNLLKTSCTNCTTLLILITAFNYAQGIGKNIFTKTLFSQLQSNISDNLSSKCYMLRSLSARALSYFSDVEGTESVYKIFLEAIEIQPTVHNYREQLLLVQKLSPSGQLYKDIQLDAVKLDCVKFLLGLLYQNFKLVWDPISTLIQELAEKLPVDDFWPIYRTKLEEVTSSIRKETALDLGESNDTFQSRALQDLQTELSPADEKVDLANYRMLLWRNISHFGMLSEIKNKEITTFFLDFVAKEYKKENDDTVLTWNLAKGETFDYSLEENTIEKIPRKSSKHRSTLGTLVAMLEVFSKMANPKQLHREPEIRSFYHELLTGTNEQLQKLALDCLMRYKIKSCMPYKDHLYALIDDKKFKDELVNFKLDAESKMIDSDHREELMPILLRVLYGKMRSKTSNKFISSQMRRSIIMRFLAGCNTDEIFWFLQMAFENYQELLGNDLERIPTLINENFLLNEVLSPKKLRSTLNLLEIIRKHFGGLMETDFRLYMLKVIVLAGSVCRCVFEAGRQVDEKYLPVFRNLRSQTLSCLVNFFDHFQDLVYKEEYVQAIFDVFVWPTLNKLPEDCLHSPTPLLKLFIAWSHNVQYFTFLGKKGVDEITPIGVSISLFASDKPTVTIRKVVLEMIERVLVMEEDGIRDAGKKRESLIMPYIPQILQRLMKSVSAKGSKRRRVGKVELFILSKITEMDLTANTCEMLLKVLIPIATGKTRFTMPEEGVAQFVSTLKNLVLRTVDPEKYIRSIIPLFERVSDVSTRKQLCQLFGELSKRDPNGSGHSQEIAEVARKLNAWDRKWIEQPDYDKRLSALRSVREKMDKGEVNMELGLLVIYNCFYFLHHDKDLGLRDNACFCMRSLVPKLIEKYAKDSREINYLVEEVMFNLIRRTLRDKNDLVRNEGILLLGEMTRNCAYVHPVLSDLMELSSKDDAEVDFFENLTHLQLHRHARALLKFSAHAKGCEMPISTRTLTQFLLPLASRYLLTENTASKHTLVDAAIEAVGIICGFLPWHQYHAVLRYYLQKMRYCREYHKQCIRIIIAVLDAFHFDLSQANGAVPHDVLIEETKSEQQEKVEELDDEDLDSELDELRNDREQNDEEADRAVPGKKLKLSPFLDRPIKVSPSTAKNVVQTITTSLIPSLNYSITELSSYESKHKVNRRRVNLEREEEESLRVPIALAIVKLLKKLPKDILDANIHGVFLKVCTFLKSPVKSVRMLARDVLKKIMLTVGPEYLYLLLSQMTGLLTRGFQVHVLSVTLFSVLDCLKIELGPRHTEKALQYILNVTLNDIFGDASDEKEVDKIGAHTPEAKPSAKSYLSLQITAQHIPQNCLLDLLIPFKHYLFKTQSKKVLTKVQDCFQKITSGLAENPNITPENLLQFIYGMVSESIPDLLVPETKLTQTEKELLARSQSDCFLIPLEPKSRSGAVRKTVKTNARANAHVLIEFGLELLHIILRRKKLESAEQLEPFISVLKKSLESGNVRICTLALKCLTSIWIAELEVEALKANIEEIVKQIFVILHKNFSFGVTKKGDSFQLVRSAMKAVGCIVKNCDYYTVNNEHVVQLLFYISQDVNESDRQPVAFSLLKSLIERQMSSKELHEIMQKLCEIAITSELNYSRDEARSVLLNYIMQFHREKRVESIMKFFIAQLNYEVVAGRMSAVQFIEGSIRKYPLPTLNKKAEVIFLAMGTRLVNEDVPECRRLIAQCLELLISRLDKANRQKLFDMAVVFFDGAKPAVREMAASLCSRFIEVEKSEFFTKAITLLPILDTHVSLSNPNAAGKFVRLMNGSDDNSNKMKGEVDEGATQRATDHAIIQLQNCILKIFTNCPQVLEENSMMPVIDSLAYESQRLLAYDHDWVRLNSVKMINSILATSDVTKLGEGSTRDEENRRQFVYSSPETDLKSLVLDLCAQLIPGDDNEELATEISRSLLYIANMLKSLQQTEHEASLKINLQWLLRRIRYVIHGEVAKAPKSSILRLSLFDWMEGVVALVDANELLNICPAMIAALIREMSEDDVNVDAKVKQKSIKIANRIRKKIGEEDYDKIRLAAQTKLFMKRAARKKELVQEKILDPARAAKRKSSQQERKKVAKRKKLDAVRGKVKKVKRKSLEDVF